MNEFEKIYERIMEEARKARDLYLEWLEIEINLKTFFPNTEEHAIKTEIMPDITTKLATKFDEQNYDFEIQFLPSMTSIVIKLKIYEIPKEYKEKIMKLYVAMDTFSKSNILYTMFVFFAYFIFFMLLKHSMILFWISVSMIAIVILTIVFSEIRRRKELNKIKKNLKDFFENGNIKCFI